MSAKDEVRVRFAPSPTGHLHLGGARTALFNWLFARNMGGKFVLRIEDTDSSRSTDEYIKSILEGMTWLGLDWDEGPHRQTERFDIYRKYIGRLLATDMAYHCYCSAEELEARRKEAQQKGLPVKYDGRCRKLTAPVKNIRPTVRFSMPATGSVVVQDMVKGSVTFDNAQLDDMIIMRSDGTPTYNLVVVVDDVDMGITHVIRGDDHLNNTPKQLHIYSALGYEVPKFAHLPMILGSDKARLSKRHGATSVTAYRDEGYLPEALINYLVRLGWSHGDQEIFTKDELVNVFSFENVGKSASVFDPEKLLWLNAEYIKSTPPLKLAERVVPVLKIKNIVPEDYEPDLEWLSKAVKTLTIRARTLTELADKLAYYIVDDVEYDEKARKKFLSEKNLPVLKDVYENVSQINDDAFNEEIIEKAFNSVMEARGLKLGKVAQPCRVALTGGTESPGIFELIVAMGRDKTFRRLKRAIEMIEGETDGHEA